MMKKYEKTIEKALILHTYASIHTGKTKSKKVMYRTKGLSVWLELGPTEPEWDFVRLEYKILNISAEEMKENKKEKKKKERELVDA